MNDICNAKEIKSCSKLDYFVALIMNVVNEGSNLSDRKFYEYFGLCFTKRLKLILAFVLRIYKVQFKFGTLLQPSV